MGGGERERKREREREYPHVRSNTYIHIIDKTFKKMKLIMKSQ